MPDTEPTERTDGMRFLPDVEYQFGSLSARPDPLGFHMDGTPNPSSCEHYQGMARVQGADGTPFLLLTRSGNTPSVPGPDDAVCSDTGGDNGYLIVFRMGSREKHGERMRSNRLARGKSYDDTPPPQEDKATIYFSFVDGGLVFQGQSSPLPHAYQHPGGMQLVGDVLAVALEQPRSSTSERTLVMFLDVSNPEEPKFLSQFVPRNFGGETLASAGVVAVTPLADDHYLMLVAGGNATTVFFYRSDITDLKSPDLTWTRMDSWGADPNIPVFDDPCRQDSQFVNGVCLSPDEQYMGTNWPSGGANGHPHQTLQFLRQGSIHGRLYLAGARGKFGTDDNSLDLYRIDCETPLCDFGEIRMKHVRTRHHKYFPNAGGGQLVNFAAATTFYVSPTSDLLFYATEHDNDGPDGTVKAGEYRHIFMVRDDSPTFAPTVTVGGPFEVDEGSSVSIYGWTTPPILRPFIQLFDELHLQNRFEGEYAVVDYPDYDLDNFDNLFAFETGFYRTTRSWNWFAPKGCTILAVEKYLFDPSAPGETKTLAGTGLVEHDPDLREVFNDSGTDNMDQKVSSVEFLKDCDDYYATPIDLLWDLDRNGSFETKGTLAFFSAAHLDGPAEIGVPAQARHPKGGPTAPATARVSVRNVKPRVTGIRLIDIAGQLWNSRVLTDYVPWVLTNLPVTVTADFSDPGVLDHQTAAVDWGDGSVDLNTAFTSFDDGFGDGTGAASHTHRYALAGLRQITFRVMDDDGGLGSRSTTLRVVTPDEVVEWVITVLDELIAGTSDENVRQNLEEARLALVGRDPRSNDGALDMIRAGNYQAALELLKQSIASLQNAQAGGSRVAPLIDLLEQAGASLSAAYKRLP